MALHRLIDFLDQRGINYSLIRHSPAYTAQQIAAAAHVPGKELAKTVVVKLDGKIALAVVPAPHQVHLEMLAKATGSHLAELAAEEDFETLFPECELGAMPPFGHLWQIPVYLSRTLTEQPRIAFNAGNHSEVMVLDLRDFIGLAEPHILDF